MDVRSSGSHSLTLRPDTSDRMQLALIVAEIVGL